MMIGIVACGVVVTGVSMLGYDVIPDFGTDPRAGRTAPFVLLDVTGREVADRDLHGSLSLLYFATSACPERCVLEYDRLIASIAALGADGVKIRPVFVTLDSLAGRAARVQETLQRFDSRTLLLTGSSKQLDAAFRLLDIRATSDGTGTPAVLLGTDGRVAASVDPGLDETRLTELLREHL
ncbi:MAG: SCO family protein [Rhodospirillales bacterium]